MKTKESLLINISVFIFLALFIGSAFMYNPRARFVPLVFAIPAIILTAWLIIKELLHKPVKEEKFDLFKVKKIKEIGETKETEAIKQTGAGSVPPKAQPQKLNAGKREVTIYLLTVAFFILVLLFGFLPAIFIFMLVFLKFFGEVGWFSSSALAVAMVAVIYATFGLVLNIPFKWGYLGII